MPSPPSAPAIFVLSARHAGRLRRERIFRPPVKNRKNTGARVYLPVSTLLSRESMQRCRLILRLLAPPPLAIARHRMTHRLYRPNWRCLYPIRTYVASAKCTKKTAKDKLIVRSPRDRQGLIRDRAIANWHFRNYPCMDISRTCRTDGNGISRNRSNRTSQLVTG